MPTPIINRSNFYTLLREYRDRQNDLFKYTSESQPTFTQRDNKYYIYSNWIINQTEYFVHAHNSITGESVSFIPQGVNLILLEDDFCRWVDYKVRFGYQDQELFKEYISEIGLNTQLFKSAERGDIEIDRKERTIKLVNLPEL